MNENLGMTTKKKLTKMQLMVTLIITMSLCITGATYAYYAISASNTNKITGSSATVNLTLDVTRVFPTESSVNTGAMIPQMTGNPLFSALKGGCVDGNLNVACQVYKITISNNGGTATQVVDGKILFYSNSTMTTDISTTMPDLKWKLVSSVNETTPTSSVMGTDTDRVANANENLATNEFVSDLTLVNNGSQTYYIIVWLNEKGTFNSDGHLVDGSGNVITDEDGTYDQSDQEGKSFFGKVQFDSSNGTGVTSTFQS